MSLNNITITVREYPEDGGEYQTLTIRNHWSWDDRAHFEIEGKKYTFLINDIRMALVAIKAGR